ncbi:uncharacterized protein LOC121378942 [Gigantopelta aegis]|uniref:uncharacterized protein LOC121378942 n=1 Tax=Gigantopelta aegis TaxID=1735272 RepID=UPI001B88DF18|nr:uncharacterized protein LOC121378942 [Gigantopelta aegis]
MASSSAVDDETQQGVSDMFDTFIELAAGKKLTDRERNVANEKAISMLLKDSLGERYKKISETSVYPVHKVKTRGDPYFGKVERSAFCNLDYFCDLAACRIELDEHCKRPPRDDERVQLEAKALMKKVAEESKKDHSVKGAHASGVAASVTSRLTDTHKYTGAHKERFDSSGHGKGIGGREYRDPHTGYTQQYKGQGTYH